MEHMLLSYKGWANTLTFQDLSAVDENELIKERHTNFKTILSTLNHVYVVDDIFKAHIEGRIHNYTSRNTKNTPSLHALINKMTEMDKWYLNWYKAMAETDLKKNLTFEFIGGGEGHMTHQEIILHLVNHATYHRGFISDMLYQIPFSPTANDLPVFLRDVWNK